MNNGLFSPRDPDAERRRALAKAYAILIRLAEEMEEETKNSMESAASETDEKNPGYVPVAEEASTQ